MSLALFRPKRIASRRISAVFASNRDRRVVVTRLKSSSGNKATNSRTGTAAAASKGGVKSGTSKDAASPTVTREQLQAELEALEERLAYESSEEALEKKLNERVRSPAAFWSFLKQSSGALINVFATFATVVLATQLIGFRARAQQLLDALEERKQEVSALQDTMKQLSDAEFSQEVAAECAEVMRTNQQHQPTQKRAWIGNHNSAVAEEENNSKLIKQLSMVVREKVAKCIGDLILSEEERNSKQVSELTKTGDEKALLRQLQEETVEIVEEKEDGTKVVKRRQFSI